MKYLGITCGRLIESFVIIPSINVTWMSYKLKTYYNINIAWLYWYITIGQVHKLIKNEWKK